MEQRTLVITVFTPTYNRAATLTRLFESLQSQRNKDFEWLVVDDGSSDNTASLIGQMRLQAHFPIRYFRQNNSGKHTAYNKGLQLAEGEWFICVDSDDWLSPESLTNIYDITQTIPLGSMGAVALKCNANGVTIGTEFSQPGQYVTLHELELSGQGGERTLVFRTQLARKYPFPVLYGEKFMTEAVVYDRMKGHKFLVMNKCLTICEYQSEGLSSNPKALMLKNPGGYKIYFSQRIDLAPSISHRMACALKYNFFKMRYTGTEVPDYTGPHSTLVSLLRPLTPLVAAFYYRIGSKTHE